MNTLLYWAVLALVRLIQALPLGLVARLGRAGGAVAWAFDRRHRRVILDNLRACFGSEMSPEQIRAMGRENMLRIGENYAAALKTSIMSHDEALKICQVEGLEKFPRFGTPGAPSSCIVAVGHFGNFELHAILGKLVPGLLPAATYRGLDHPALDRLLLNLRGRSGCRFFERRTEAAALKQALSSGGILLGLLSDQHGGNNGIWGPFLGRECSTTPAPAIFALRYGAPLFTAVCRRTALGRWRVEVGDEIPTWENGAARSAEAITADINRAFEAAVRRDPANWFWVHKRWKKPPVRLRGKHLQANGAS